MSGAPIDEPDYEQRLQRFVGIVVNERPPGPDPVNVPMIRHWVEALDVHDPVHLEPEAARATGRPDVVSPAAMIQAWVMRGYAATVRPDPVTPASGNARLLAVLDEGGYTSVVATDSDLELRRELHPGDLVGYTEQVESIGPPKRTGLGIGRFVTTIKTYTDGAGEVVATQRWRTLRFRPRTSGEAN